MAKQPYSSEKVEEWRRRLIGAATRIYLAEGLDAVSFRRVAKDLGCSYTTPYSYFDSKSALIAALKACAYTSIGHALSTAAAGCKSTRSVERLKVIVAAYIEQAVSNPRQYHLMLEVATLSDDDDPELEAAKKMSFGVCLSEVRAAIVKGEIAETADADSIAHVIWAAAHGLVSLQLSGQLVMGRTIKQLVEPLVEMIAAGLRPDESRRHPTLRAVK
jgi:AcrR family transcriptional regulator